MASIISAGTTDSTSLNISSDKTGILQLASNNSTVAVTIDASQNLLVGTSTVAGSSQGLNIGTPNAGSTSTPIALQNRSTANNSGVQISFRGLTSTGAESDYGYLKMAVNDTTAKNSYMGFWTTNGGTIAERMRISSAGYVGINNTNPVGLGQLEVQAPSTGAALWVQTGGTNSGYTIAEFRTGTNAPALQIYGDASSTVGGTISSNITPGKYTIDASNLGIGTSIANNGTVDFSAASGMLVVNNWTNGALTIYICGGGSTVNVSSVTGTVGTFVYQSSINGYRWTNTYGSTATFGFFFVRTRPGA